MAPRSRCRLLRRQAWPPTASNPRPCPARSRRPPGGLPAICGASRGRCQLLVNPNHTEMNVVTQEIRRAAKPDGVKDHARHRPAAFQSAFARGLESMDKCLNSSPEPNAGYFVKKTTCRENLDPSIGCFFRLFNYPSMQTCCCDANTTPLFAIYFIATCLSP